jgi:hypothetical protein
MTGLTTVSVHEAIAVGRGVGVGGGVGVGEGVGAQAASSKVTIIKKAIVRMGSSIYEQVKKGLEIRSALIIHLFMSKYKDL